MTPLQRARSRERDAAIAWNAAHRSGDLRAAYEATIRHMAAVTWRRCAELAEAAERRPA